MSSEFNEGRPSDPSAGLARGIGVFAGIATQVGFLVTVMFLFLFLKEGRSGTGKPWLMVDVLLALQFPLIHSLLLHPTIKRELTRWLPSAFYGCFFCTMTCLNLGLVFLGWRGSGGSLWNLTGVAEGLTQVGFYGSWVALFYSLYISGLGYQTGLTPWWYWLRRLPEPRRSFQVVSIYRWIRHPIYLSFMGLIWFTPRMTWDHVLLTAIWTLYIFVGSYLKDERLAFYLGGQYRRYQEQVAGYPMVFFGPLGRRRIAEATPVIHSLGSLSPNSSIAGDYGSRASERAA